MAKRDYYKVLDVPRTATEAEIKKAYRRLAMKYHPDRNPDDRDAEESFKEAKEACEVLTDPHKRAAYDQHGHAGVDNGDRVRLAGEGEAGRNGGPPGDLYVEVHVREHPIFERDGEHLTCEVPVSFATAALGGTVEVPTLDGDVTLKVPSETQSGRVFRLRDKGVKPVRGGPRGDLFCRVVVETPVHLSTEQRDLIRKLEETLRQDSTRHAPREQGFFEGVKRFF